MKFSNVYVYNFLVHYGPESNQVFIDAVDDGVLDFLINNPDVVIRKKEQFLEELEILSGSKGIYLHGKFSKQFNFHTERVKELDKRADKIIDVESLPHSYFYLDLVNHRIVWVKPRGITGAPEVTAFTSFFKRQAYLHLKNKTIQEANMAYEGMRAAGLETPRKSLFVSQYLKEQGVRFKDVQVNAVPLIDKSSVRDLVLDSNYLVRSITLKVYKPNASDRDIQSARGNFDSISKTIREKFNSDTVLTIKPDDPEGIENKENVVEIATDVNELNNIEVEIELQNKQNKKEKQIINTNPENTSSDIRYKKEFEKDGEELSTEDVETIKEDLEYFEIENTEKTENEGRVLNWLESLRSNFPGFPIKEE